MSNFFFKKSNQIKYIYKLKYEHGPYFWNPFSFVFSREKSLSISLFFGTLSLLFEFLFPLADAHSVIVSTLLFIVNNSNNHHHIYLTLHALTHPPKILIISSPSFSLKSTFHRTIITLQVFFVSSFPSTLSLVCFNVLVVFCFWVLSFLLPHESFH